VGTVIGRSVISVPSTEVAPMIRQGRMPHCVFKTEIEHELPVHVLRRGLIHQPETKIRTKSSNNTTFSGLVRLAAFKS